MEFKNKKFNLFGEEWSLQFVDKLEVDPNAEPGAFRFGETSSIRHIIRIATLDDEDITFPDEVINNTIMHELIHAILDSGQYLPSSEDEPMVEWISRCLLSLLKQKVI